MILVPTALFYLAATLPPDPDALPPVAEIEETLVVTAARQEEPVSQAVSLVTVVPREELEASPALALDGQMRQLPGFSLFRRAASLEAHPTTQGVSLRGIGPSGTSRTLVLWDGLPLNDPFGGWVYWNRLPRLSLEGVEVVRGAGSGLYGSSALGGVIQLLPRRAEEGATDVDLRIGERDTYGAEAFFSDLGRRWSGTLGGSFFRTSGHFILRPQDRGTIDRPARVTYGSLSGRLYRGGYHLGVQAYREERGNGTALQTNSSWIHLLEAGFRGPRWEWSLHGQGQELESVFTRVLPGRDAEIVTARQRFPSRALGGSLLFRQGDGWLVGADGRQATWEDQEQNLAGVFLQRSLEPTGRLRLLLGGRFDLWENAGTEISFNPRVGLVYRATTRVILRSSVYRGFRAPTLNELYRPFQVGNVQTLANPRLDEERLVGVEGGVDLRPRDPLSLRINAFWNELRGPVGNVTLEVTETGILRQRQNLGRVTIRGAEVDAALRLDRWSLRAAYLYSASRVAETGLQLPQAPRHSATLRLERRGRLRTALQGRWTGVQFEDDRNQLPLEAALVVDAYLEGAVRPDLVLFLAVENLFDETVPVGRLPEPRIGPPRSVHGGLRLRRGR